MDTLIDRLRKVSKPAELPISLCEEAADRIFNLESDLKRWEILANEQADTLAKMTRAKYPFVHLRMDASESEREGALRDKLIELGWMPPSFAKTWDGVDRRKDNKGLLMADHIEFRAWFDSALPRWGNDPHGAAWCAWQAATRRLEGRIAELKQTPSNAQIEGLAASDLSRLSVGLAAYL